MTFLKQIDGRWQGRGNASPRNFFQSAEPGFYLDFSNPAGLFQDNTGTTPLTTPDQQIGLAADRSRNRSPITVAAAVQASLGLRPKWGRAPKVKRNLLTSSEAFDSAAWIKGVSGTATAPVVTPNAALAPNGEMTADLVQLRLNGAVDGSFSWLYQNIAVPSGATRATSFYVKAATPGDVGKVIRLIGTTTNAVTLTADWQRISNSALVAVGTVISVGIRLRGFEGTSDSVDLHLWAGQFEDGAIVTPYQKVTTGYDITESGVPSYGYMRPDLSDDVLTVTTPAAQTGDVLVFGRNGSWIESGVTYGSGAAVTIGINTVTGLPQGLLTAIGDVVGIVAIGRTLTAAERTQALEYHKARGAAGWLVAGAEAEPNGAFASGTGWTVLAGWAISGGAANATATSASLTSTTTLTAGKLYLVTFDWTHTSGTLVVRAGVGAQATFTTSGAKRVILQTTSVSGVEFYGGAVTGALDNVSVKPLTVAA